MFRSLLASAAVLMLSAAVVGSISAQVAPTLPHDTLFGKPLPPEADLPHRGAVAPTLPRDTLGYGVVSPDANSPAFAPAPTLPGDTLLIRDSIEVDSAIRPAAPSSRGQGAPIGGTLLRRRAERQRRAAARADSIRQAQSGRDTTVRVPARVQPQRTPPQDYRVYMPPADSTSPAAAPADSGSGATPQR